MNVGSIGEYIRQQRGTETLSDADARMVKSYMPYGD